MGTYQKSGLSAYLVPEGVSPTNHTQFEGPNGPGFPYTWSPRYTIAHGWSAFPDKREDFQVNDYHERIPATRNSSGFFYNPQDNPKGFAMSGNIGTSEGQGVHSLASGFLIDGLALISGRRARLRFRPGTRVVQRCHEQRGHRL